MKFWKKVKRVLFGPYTEQGFVEASLRRHKQKLFDIEDAFDCSRDCCQDCMTGGYYTRLIEKINRIEKQLTKLKNRKRKK